MAAASSEGTTVRSLEAPAEPASGVVAERDTTTATVAGWGRLAQPGRERLGEDLEQLSRSVPLMRGLGRSYGDASLPPPDRPVVAGTRLADRLLAFDAGSGVVRAEAGLSLGALNRAVLPRGWASPVMTGTQFVTLGGMVAADVHGKNHHVDGCFGRHVERLRMRVFDQPGDHAGRVVWCSRSEHPDLFRATLGGMGLTGHVLEVEARLSAVPSPWIWAEQRRMKSLDEVLAGLRESAGNWPFTVAWIDYLAAGRGSGRGVLFCGRWATAEEAPAAVPPRTERLSVPFVLPGWVLNRFGMRAFNLFYYLAQRPRKGTVHPEAFFHPLDTIASWNRLYGPRGFSQYQCVLPHASCPDAVREVLQTVASSGVPSLLTVAKDCGDEGEGLLSFPLPGISVALDLPHRPGTQHVVDRLNALVTAAGGRIYLAKDALTRAADFRAMEHRLDAFEAVRRRWDPAGRLASAQSRRLLEGS